MIEAITTALLALFAGTTIVQVAPIKCNPWSWLAKAIGRAINAEVIQKVDKLEGDLKKIKEHSEERAAKSCRIRILRFGDEILHDVHHSKEHFDQILQDITELRKRDEELERLNAELAEKGYMVVTGKVSRKFFEERFYGMNTTANQQKGEQ